MHSDSEMKNLNQKWFNLSFEHRYHYNFNWLGLPIIQYPQDIIDIHEKLGVTGAPNGYLKKIA